MLSFITKGSQEQILLLRRVTLPVDIPEGVSPVLVFLFGFASVFLQLFLQNVTTSVFGQWINDQKQRSSNIWRQIKTTQHPKTYGIQ